MPKGVSSDQYSPTTIIVKMRPGSSQQLSGKSSSEQVMKSVNRAIPQINRRSHPLANIYKVEIEQGQDLQKKINELLADPDVVYAEPYFNHRPLLIPNDPNANPTTGGQTYLSIINAYDAWTVERGDSTIVIGILDSGVQPDHGDLESQIAYNFNDPINGIDDDGDGLIDNFAGWDIADNDNNPTADNDEHGTEVTGVSSARVNNNLGIAGTGFNSKFLPIKIFTSSSNNFNFGYEAIALAADLGCKVINLSWGSTNSFSQFGQDVINYAVLEKDAVVIAAAGNTDELLDFYPASFDNVLSVSATNIQDEKAFFATFSYKIDMVAPGENIFVATNGNTYGTGKVGTSYSAPMVAGAAALVRARFPNLSAVQVMEKMRVTSDDIYNVPANGPYIGQLGKGRLNMLEALTNNSTPSVRIKSMNYSNGLGEYIYANDTISITTEVINYLTSLSSGTTTLSTSSPYVTVVNDSYAISSLNTLESKSNSTDPFLIVTSNDLPPDEELVFRVDFESSLYSDFEYFIIDSSPSNTIAQSGDLALTVTSDGDLGYDNEFFDQGIGVTYESNKVLDNIGVMISFSQDQVADNSPTNLVIGSQDADFGPASNLKRFSNGHLPTDIRSSFTVADSILIEQKTLANQSSNVIIQEYRLTNTGIVDLSNFQLGIFADWNIGIKDFNQANWIGDQKLGYINNGSTYLGIALLTNQDSIYSAINNKNFNGNSADIPNVLNDSVKYSHSSQGILKSTAGMVNGGNDVSHVVGAEIPLLEVNKSEKVAFAIVAGHSVQDLIDELNIAKTDYQENLNNPPTISISETCPGDPAIINPQIGVFFDFYSDVELSNLLFSGESFNTPPVSTSTSYYAINKDQPFDSDVYRVIAKPKPVNASFLANPNPLLLDETGNSTVTFIDQSNDAVSWNWDFDNGFTSTVKQPIMNFTQTGTYDISLTATNDIGCTEIIIDPITVSNRSNLPDLVDQEVCKGEEFSLQATNATNLEFYSDLELNEMLFSGISFTGSFNQDTTLYVISTDSTFNSNIKEVKIDVDDVTSNFIFNTDTTDLSSSSLLKFRSLSKSSALDIWYINDNLTSTLQDFTFDYTDNSVLNILLIAESITGCRDSLNQTLNIQKSPTPSFEDVFICENEDVLIDPPGQFLNFYADQNLTELISKGSSATLPTVVDDTIIYVTNSELIGESDALEIAISVSEITADFEPEITPLNLYNNSAVQFNDLSTSAVSWLWKLSNDTISVEQNPIISFNNIGEFEIKQTVTDEIGCIDSTTILYEVVNITSLQETSEFLFYPNPSSDFIYISSPVEINATLISPAGKIIGFARGINPTIDVRNFESGQYYLKVETNTESLTYKIIIR